MVMALIGIFASSIGCPFRTPLQLGIRLTERALRPNYCALASPARNSPFVHNNRPVKKQSWTGLSAGITSAKSCKHPFTRVRRA